jgi:long-chain acyl-CoA synthetase
MKKEGLCPNVRTLICMNGAVSELQEEASKVDLTLMNFRLLLKDMELVEVELEHTKKEDNYIFSYTSGTTGDAKGVKLNHKNIISSTQTIKARFPVLDRVVAISYLPYPHSFE